MEEIIKMAFAVSAMAACIALIIGIVQISHVNRKQRQQTACTLYAEFIEVGITHPVFAYAPGFAEQFDFAKQEISGSKEKFERV